MYDNSCCFEPTDTLNGSPILPGSCQAPTSSEGLEGKVKVLVAVTHLALLGVKRQEPAFWGKKQSAWLFFYLQRHYDDKIKTLTFFSKNITIVFMISYCP